HPGADDEEDEDEDDKGRRPGSCAASSWTPGPAPSAPGPRSPDAAASAAWVAKKGAPHCALLHEIAGARPAFEPGREMLGCLGELQRVRPTRGVAPTWGLV